ncbi:MAG: flagellar filament capping protein FliD [Deltaproteobacteria bacterium]|nr:flagellar filament capping protein FliD [Deltaproteobacteria bacterium]
MATVSSTGLVSGLDIEGIISKLMAVESRSLDMVKAEKAAYESKISAFGTLLNYISTLKSASTPLKSSSVLGLKAGSSDTSVFTATATSSASAGSYNIKVNQLAQAHAVYSQTYAAGTDVVGTGTLSIQVGSAAAVDVTIDSSNNTLDGIKDAVNQANAGVKASVINDGTGYRLVIASNTTGASNAINVTVADDDLNNTDTSGLSALSHTAGAYNMTESQAAQDAILIVDSLTVTRSSNTISDLISGVTMTLKKDSAGTTHTLTLSKDTDSLKSLINSYISAYNKLISEIKSEKGTQAANGPMYGDSTVNSLNEKMRQVTITDYSGSTLAAMGVTHDKTGVLSLDSTRFDEALADNESGVIATLNSMASSFETAMTDYINVFIPARTDSYSQTVTRLEKKMDNLGNKLDLIENSLRKKFAALELTLSQLQNQGSYLNQIFKINTTA